MLGKIFKRWHFHFFLIFFSPEIRISYSCKISPSPVSGGKNKITSLSCAELAQRVVKGNLHLGKKSWLCSEHVKSFLSIEKVAVRLVRWNAIPFVRGNSNSC